MMIVYRFERQGVGAFMAKDNVKMGRNPKMAERAQRVLHAHGERGVIEKLTVHRMAVNNGLYFAMPSKEALKAYFGYRLKDLFKKGFRIRAYEVQEGDYMRVGAEIAFDMNKARRIR